MGIFIYLTCDNHC